MQKEIIEVCWRKPGKISRVFHMQCIFKTLVVSTRPTKAFCEDNISHLCVLKVCLAFFTAWDEQSNTIRAACNFSLSIFASMELHVFRGCSAGKRGQFPSSYIQHWVFGPKGWRIVAHFPVLHQPPLFPLSVFLLPLQLLPLFLIVSERWKHFSHFELFCFLNLSLSLPAALRLYVQKTPKINVGLQW